MRRFLLALLLSSSLSAQSPVGTLVFTASVNHDDDPGSSMAVTSYVVQAVDEATGQAMAQTNIGKPPYDPVRDIYTPFSSLTNLYQPNGIYHLTVAAIGAGGMSAQIPSPPFVYCPVVAPPPPPPPGLSLSCPVNISRVDDGTPITFQPIASGGVAPITATCTPASGSLFPVGTTTVNCSAQDAVQQTASCAFTVTQTAAPPPPPPPVGFSLVSSVKGISGFDQDSFTTAAITTTGADLLVACLADARPPVAPVLSDSKGNVWRLGVQDTQFAAERLYYAFNAVVGPSHTFTVSGSDFFGGLQVYAFSGGAATDPLDRTNHGFRFGGSTFQAGPVTPSVNGELIVACVNHAQSATPTINSGFSLPLAETSTAWGHTNGAASYLIQGTSATVNPTWTIGSGNQYGVIATFKGR